MKNRLALKFILAYAVFGVLAFALVAVFGSRLCLRAALRSASDELYREARTIASYQSSSYASSHGFDPAYLVRYSSITDCRVLILDSTNRVLFDTDLPSLLGRTIAFDPADSASFYRVGDFYGAFQNETLSVFSPIIAQTYAYGYVTLHQPMSIINSRADAMLGNLYLISASVFAISLLLLLVLHFTVLKPLEIIL